MLWVSLQNSSLVCKQILQIILAQRTVFKSEIQPDQSFKREADCILANQMDSDRNPTEERLVWQSLHASLASSMQLHPWHGPWCLHPLQATWGESCVLSDSREKSRCIFSEFCYFLIIKLPLGGCQIISGFIILSPKWGLQFNFWHGQLCCSFFLSFLRTPLLAMLMQLPGNSFTLSAANCFDFRKIFLYSPPKNESQRLNISQLN